MTLPSPARRSRPARLLSLAPALFILGLCAPPANALAQTPPAQPKPPPGKEYLMPGGPSGVGRTDFDAGEIALFGNVEVKVNSVRRNYIPRSTGIPEGKEYILLNITLRNTGRFGACIGSLDLKHSGGHDSSGNWIEEIHGENGTGLKDPCLKPNKPVTYDATYLVPAGAGDLVLQWEKAVVSAKEVDGKPVGTGTLVYRLRL